MICDYCGNKSNLTVHDGFILCPVCLGILPHILPSLIRARFAARVLWIVAAMVFVACIYFAERLLRSW